MVLRARSSQNAYDIYNHETDLFVFLNTAIDYNGTSKEGKEVFEVVQAGILRHSGSLSFPTGGAP